MRFVAKDKQQFPTGYFTTLSSSAKRVRERYHPMQSVLPPGLGTIYAWDFAFVKGSTKNMESHISSGQSDSYHFRYIGQAARRKTQERITEHVNSAITGGGGNDNRKMYLALGNALRKDTIKHSSFPDKNSLKSVSDQDPNSIVRVVQVASFFDLAALEGYMITKNDNGDLTSPKSVNSFSSLINGGKNFVGLNTDAYGVNAMKAGTKKPIEAIYAAFFYLTETDPTVIAARKQAESIGREKLPDPKTLINNGDYKEATKELIIQTGLDSIFDVTSKNFDSLLNSFYSKVEKTSGLSTQTIKAKDGTKTDTKLIDLEKFFSGQLLLAAKLDVSDKAILSMTFDNLFKEDEITESSIQKAKKAAEKRKGETFYYGKIFENLFYNLGKKNQIKIDVKNWQDTAVEIINERLKSKFSIKIDMVTREQVFSEKARRKQDMEIEAGNMNYISKEDLNLISQAVIAYSIAYFEAVGLPPEPNEIAGLIGNFAEGKKLQIISQLKKLGLNEKEAEEQSARFYITSDWTVKEKKK